MQVLIDFHHRGVILVTVGTSKAGAVGGGRVRFLERLSQFLLYLGVPGVFLIALLDSAAVPMVGGPDAAVLLLSWQNPSKVPAIVLAATVGSLLGCLFLYRVARAGGQFALARVRAEKRERVMRMIERNATWAVFMSVAMPPPFPTKPVILAAGAFRAPLVPFTLTVFVGRILRFSALAWLGARFGERAVRVLKAHYLFILGVLLVFVTVIWLVRRIRRNPDEP